MRLPGRSSWLSGSMRVYSSASLAKWEGQVHKIAILFAKLIR